MILLPILIKDPRPCVFSPCGWPLIPWVAWNDIRNLLWLYHIFKTLKHWIPTIAKIIISSLVQMPILTLITQLKMPYSVTTSLFSLSEVHPTILVSFPISSWGFLYKSATDKYHLEPSVSKPCSSIQFLFLTCFLQILSVTSLNPLFTAAGNAKLICVPLNLLFGSKSSKVPWLILGEVTVH